MRKTLLVVGILLVAVLAGADQIIQYSEKMVGANHPLLADTLNRGFLIQHDKEGVHTAVPWSVLTGVDNTITNTHINSSAAIDATKIGAGTVSNTELGYLDNASSNIQTQLNARVLLGSAPDNATATCVTGTVAYDNNYVYWCYATNKWRRAGYDNTY